MQSNVEIIRSGFAAFETADMDAFTAHWAPDVVWDVSGYRNWPGEEHVYRGEAEILGAFGRFLSGAVVQRIDIHEISEVGDDRVIALYTESRRAAGSDAVQDLPIGIVYTLRDGQVARMEVHSDHDAARLSASSGP